MVSEVFPKIIRLKYSATYGLHYAYFNLFIAALCSYLIINLEWPQKILETCHKSLVNLRSLFRNTTPKPTCWEASRACWYISGLNSESSISIPCVLFTLRKTEPLLSPSKSRQHVRECGPNNQNVFIKCRFKKVLVSTLAQPLHFYNPSKLS